MKNILRFLLLIVVCLIPAFFAMTPVFLKDRPVWPDEAFFVDSVKTLATTGRLATNIFGNTIPGMKQNALWNPPLYFYALAGWIKVFGSSIEAVRMLSVVLSVFALGVFFTIAKFLFKNFYLALFGTLFLAFDLHFSESSRMARMEMLTFLFLLLSLLVFLQAEKRENTKLFLLAGILAGIATLVHPLGFIAPAVLTLDSLIGYILCKEKFSKALLIIVPVGIANLIWLLSIKDYLNILFIQYGLQFARKSLAPPFAVALFETNPFWRIIFVLYILLVLVQINQTIKRRNKLNVFLLVGFFVSTAVFMWGKEMWYLLYFQPFMTLIILSLLKNYKKLESKIVSLGVFLSAGVIFLFNPYLFISQLILPGDYHAFTKQIIQSLPKHGDIFIASIPDPYFDLQSNKNLKFYEALTVPVPKKAYKKLLDSSDYIVQDFIPDTMDEFYTDYLSKNLQSFVTIRNGTYEVSVIQLVPRNQRR